MNLKRWCVLVGGFSIHFCIGIPFLFGNFVTYIVAFMHSRGFYEEADIGSDVWVFGLFNGSLVITMLISSIIVSKCGFRITLFIANCTFTSGYVLTYLSVQHSVWATVVTYGLICGLGAGISIVTTIDLASKWFPKHVATVCAVLLAGFSTGGTAFNQIVSLYVNPDNLTPHGHLGSLRVFNQTEVLERVPSTFLLLGGIIFILQLVGIIISFTPPDNNYEEFIGEGEGQISRDNHDDNKAIVEENQSIGNTRNLSLLQVLNDPGGYVLWIVVFSSLTSLMGIQFMYKNFGQTFIHDDHFLTTLGATAAILSAVYKLTIALIADVTSTKIVFILNMCLSTILCMTLYQTTHLPRGWLFFWVCALYCGLSSTLVLAPSIVRTMWGSLYFSTNLAIVWTAVSLSGIGCPLLVDNLLNTLGWKNLWYIFGSITAIGFLFSICLGIPFLPHRKTKQNSTELSQQKEH